MSIFTHERLPILSNSAIVVKMTSVVGMVTFVVDGDRGYQVDNTGYHEQSFPDHDGAMRWMFHSATLLLQNASGRFVL